MGSDGEKKKKREKIYFSVKGCIFVASFLKRVWGGGFFY